MSDFQEHVRGWPLRRVEVDTPPLVRQQWRRKTHCQYRDVLCSNTSSVRADALTLRELSGTTPCSSLPRMSRELASLLYAGRGIRDKIPEGDQGWQLQAAGRRGNLWSGRASWHRSQGLSTKSCFSAMCTWLPKIGS